MGGQGRRVVLLLFREGWRGGAGCRTPCDPCSPGHRHRGCCSSVGRMVARQTAPCLKSTRGVHGATDPSALPLFRSAWMLPSVQGLQVGGRKLSESSRPSCAEQSRWVGAKRVKGGHAGLHPQTTGPLLLSAAVSCCCAACCLLDLPASAHLRSHSATARWPCMLQRASAPPPCSRCPCLPRSLAHSALLLTPSLTLAHHNSETSRVDEARSGEQGTQGGGVTRVCGEQRQRLASESVCAG